MQQQKPRASTTNYSAIYGTWLLQSAQINLVLNHGCGRRAHHQEPRRALHANGASSGSERSMPSSRGSSRGHPRGEYQDGINVSDAGFRPSHCVLVKFRRLCERKPARLSRAVLSWAHGRGLPSLICILPGSTKRWRNIFPRWVEVLRDTISLDSPILLGSPLASTSDKQRLWVQFETAGTAFLITTILDCFKMDMACCWLWTSGSAHTPTRTLLRPWSRGCQASRGLALPSHQCKSKWTKSSAWRIR